MLAQIPDVTVTGDVCAECLIMPITYPIGEGEIPALLLWGWLKHDPTHWKDEINNLCHRYSQPRAGECPWHAPHTQTPKGCTWAWSEPGIVRGRLSSIQGMGYSPPPPRPEPPLPLPRFPWKYVIGLFG